MDKGSLFADSSRSSETALELQILPPKFEADDDSHNSTEPNLPSLSRSSSTLLRGQPRSFKSRLSHHARSQFPVISRRATVVYNYLRGTRPNQSLPEPTPYLDVIGRRINISPESTLLRFTRRFTSPWLLVLLVPAYIIGLAFIVKTQFYEVPSDALVTCTSTYWLANDQCGLDGEGCISVSADQTTYEFKCPSQCESVILLNPRTVGNEAVDNVPLIVGGGDTNRTYRGDSFLCAAAMHAGIVSDSRGGCASLDLTGNFTNFLGSTAHGLTSIGFPTTFPLSFRLSPSTSLSHCTDIRDFALAFNTIITALLFFVLRPKPITLFWCLVCIGYWHVTFFSQPRSDPPPISDAFGTFLPALFVAYAFWRMAFRFVLPAFAHMPIERGVWYLGAFWPGVLINVVTTKIPIDRLLPSDIDGDKGAIIAITLIAIALFAVAINQARVMRKTGWLFHYAFWYGTGGLVALVLSQLPGLELRVHHYILATMILPCTAFPTRLSAIYQGFFLGMFLNGVAAFDFDSILQTSAELQRDAPAGTVLPTFLTNSSTWNASIPFTNQSIFWNDIPAAANNTWNGFSLLVDDVERYAGVATNFSLAALDAAIPHFFRLAFQEDGTSGDFTKAATLWPNGSWIDPLPGPS